jgi:hypothetical protein
MRSNPMPTWISTRNFVDRFEAAPSGKHRFVVNECSESTRGTAE